MSAVRSARVRALAKLNLDLRVLGKRPDGFHELRSIFQTISLADTLDIGFTPARKTVIELDDALGIPDNLVTRAARLVLDATRTTGRVEMQLSKRIPMGAGLGGGSSDAAAVLLALPVLTGRPLPIDELARLGQQLGSDIPFFLHGGAAVGIGRGGELFPLPDGPSQHALVVASDVHVNTAQAYRDLSPRLTSESQENKIFSFQAQVWGRGVGGSASNDFEEVVFAQHPSLAATKRRLLLAGASEALMTGSGSAVFGLFADREAVSAALRAFVAETAHPVRFVSRKQYRQIWWRSLQAHITERAWPLQSSIA